MAIDNSKPGYIYCITNTIDDKKYVGKTNSPGRRWDDHRKDCLNPLSKQYNKLLYRAMRKYGIENFSYSILQKYPTSKSALEDEDRWINLLQSRQDQHGYNCAPGGAGPDCNISKRIRKKPGLRHTDQSKHKMSQSRKEAHRLTMVTFLPIKWKAGSGGSASRTKQT